MFFSLRGLILTKGASPRRTGIKCFTNMDFFQRVPPFLIQLQNILRKYPDGGQILKELIQNADDAKASEVIFVYDERQYGTETIYSKELCSIQGPALLVYNNEMFTERDWEGIQKPGNSIKRKDPDTVGRFGLGFNSVYHITDYPCIFSGKYIGILDPQEEVFNRGGLLWSLEGSRKWLDELADQFHPFQSSLDVIGCGSWNEVLSNGCFKGTLFRFPLRARPSEISDNIYSSEKMQELYESFIKDANISLLFLRHVNTVSLKKIGNDGKVCDLLTVSVSTERITEMHLEERATQTYYKGTSLKVFGKDKEEYKWLLIASSVHGKLFSDLIELGNKLCNKPALDLAYPLSKQGIDLFAGRLSCVLPLPDKEENRTGLPVIINGCFELTDDRRSMKWLEVDRQHDEAAKWNHILVERLLPLVYTCAVKDTVSLVNASKITIEAAYAIWPDPAKTEHKARWYTLTKQVASCLMREKVLQTAGKCNWISAPEAVFLFCDDEELYNCLEELLLLLNQPLVKVPEQVHKTLTLAEKRNNISPASIRTLLRNGDWRSFPREKNLLLLGYIISDGDYNDLLNIQLLPLSDGTFISFQNTDGYGMAYIDSKDFPRILLPGYSQRFLPNDIPEDLLSQLQIIGKRKIFKNLVCLDIDVIKRNLTASLPKTWNSCDNQVIWCPGDPSNPPVEWLSVFWEFLEHNKCLSTFENQPLVPLNHISSGTSVRLARLQKNTALLYWSKERHILNDCIANVLEQIGCTIIQKTSSWLCHTKLSEYILEPTPNNILTIFSYLKQITQTLASMPEKNLQMLANFLSQACPLSELEMNVICQLPIFCSVKTLDNSNSALVPALNLCALENTTFPEVPGNLVFPKALIKCRDEEDRRLLCLMNIPFLHAKDAALLLVKAIHQGLYASSPPHVQNIMLWILSNGDTLFTQSNDLIELCKSLSFIPFNGECIKPSVLYDPTVNVFKELFGPEKFPPTAYNETVVLKSLRTLGLKDSINRISVDDVLQISTKITEGDYQASLQKAKALIKVCNETGVLSQCNESDLDILRSLPWVPVESVTLMIEPGKLKSLKYRNFVEYSMYLTNYFNKSSSEILGLNKPPAPKKVVENLQILSRRFQKIDPSSFHMKLHNIYNYLQENCTSIQNVLIWNGDDFSNVGDIVLFYPESLELSPYVKKVPGEFLIYKDLFIKCGVCEKLSENEVTSILYTLKKSLGTEHKSNCLKEMRLAISILDWMKAKSVQGNDDLPIPVEDGRNNFSLQPLCTTVFCDMDKQHLNDILTNSTDYYIVHEDVSSTTARFLNIPLLSTKVLNPEIFEPWGPSEPITLRIKNILREYSEQAELFKELIQNAEDAEATVCQFLVDRRQNSGSHQSLIDPDMANCHGPALWSYNDRKFTDNDFRNITRIGASTKETEMKKIGKFGLGFNTVYHITDVPTIMSGSNVLIFDPNVNHIKKHILNSANPGIKLNLRMQPDILHVFSDQFQPFSNVFGCDLNKPFSYDGTLIRLPFRTEKEAKDSQICQQPFTEEQINGIIHSFEEAASTLLIFLKNIHKVGLNCLEEDLCPQADKSMVMVQRDKVQTLDMPDKTILQEQINALNILRMNMNILDFTGSDIIKMTVTDTKTAEETYYLVQSSLGIKESLQMFSQNKRFNTYLPVAGVALPLRKHYDTEKLAPNLRDFSGKVFCFLPLPVSSGLPFHLNGTFAVMSNRKNLWDTTEKGEWNRKLLGDAAVVALIQALTQLQKMSNNGDIQDYYYYTFWPDITKSKTQFTEVAKAFYQAIAFGLADFLPELFSNGQESCSIKYACFLQLDNIQDEQMHKLANTVFYSVLKKPYMAIPLPEMIKNSFIASDCSSELLPNTFDCERFYREIVFANLALLDAQDRNALIIYAIDLDDKQLDNLLMSQPCIPSSNGKLQLIGKLVHPEGKVSLLYDEEEGCFPQGVEFLTSRRLERLKALGMRKDSLPMDELMERAHQINSVWKKDIKKGLQQICCVLELLEDLLYLSPGNEYETDFRNIVFLPSVSPQSQYEGINDLLLMNSRDLYHYKHKALVCLIKPVLSEEHVAKQIEFSVRMLTFLGLDRIPTSEMIIMQLQEACKMHSVLRTEDVSQIAKNCYTFLNKLVQKEPNQLQLLKELTDSNSPFVYVGKGFVPINCVAHKMPFDVSPYLYQLPKEYQEYPQLWKYIELSEEFSICHYVAVLKQMHEKNKESPLPEDELEVALSLIEYSSKKILNKDDHQILVPDTQGTLLHADQLFYNDSPSIPFDEGLRFCHGRISWDVAIKLGIKTKTHHTLERLAVSNAFSWISDFGVKEELATRIKNIIREYSSKNDVLKELIQNADDSEATEISFVLDSRKHQTASTFGPQWNLLQGPALCIYNNKKFTENDIEGIQQLGKGGKADCLDKTGKFGTGFNTVYHITDCPSFITGDSMMCIFDPNLTFLPTSNSNRPGGKINVNNEFKGRFEDVYNTFLPSWFDLQEGTLFRLPLRIAETATNSKICDQTVSCDDIRLIFQELESEADSMTLFLNSISKITFSEISHKDELHEILRIETNIEGLQNNCCDFKEKLNQLAENDRTMSEAVPFRRFYRLQITSSSKKTQRWLLAKQIGFEGNDCVATLQKISDGLQQTLIPHGAVAACKNDFQNLNTCKAFCTLPLPVETGLPVHINANFIVDSSRRGICNEDGESQKTQWNRFLLINVIAPLYCSLLDLIHKEFIRDKEDTIVFKSWKSCKLFLDKFLYFFPSITQSVPPQWHEMVNQVYRTISEKHCRYIPVYKTQSKRDRGLAQVEWSVIGQSSILEEPYFLFEEEYEKIGIVLHNIGMKVAFGGCSHSLYKQLKAAGVKVMKLHPKSLCNFLKSVTSQWQGKLPLPISDTVLKEEKNCKVLLQYCLDKPKTEKVVDLQDVPLLLTEDDMLRYFNRDDIKYYSQFHNLFPSFCEEFAKSQGLCHHELLVKCGFLRDLTIKDAFLLLKKHPGLPCQLAPERRETHPKLLKENTEWFQKLWQFFSHETNPENETCQEIITLFSDWAILPVYYKKHPTESILLPLSKLKYTLVDNTSEVATILYTLGFPKLNLFAFGTTTSIIKPYIMDIKDCFSVLEQLCSEKDLHWEELESFEIDSLLRFFLRGLNNSARKYFIDRLQTLPLFETHQGKRQSLNRYTNIYILDSTIHFQSKRLYELDSHTVFLKNTSLNEELAKHTHMSLMKEVTFLAEYLLFHFELLNEDEFVEVLLLIMEIKHLVDFEHVKDVVFAALRPLKLIRDQKGKLQKASYFFDHEVKLFDTLELHSMFIPELLINKFNKYKIAFHELLLDMGLKNKLSEDEFIEFAKNVEKDAEGSLSLEPLIPKSDGLIKYLVSMDINTMTNRFRANVGSIHFLIPSKVQDDLKCLHSSYTKETKMIALKVSLLEKNEEYKSLVWTSMALIKTISGLEQNGLFILEKCGVFHSPPADLVVENVKNVCRVTCETKAQLDTRQQVLESNYNFLQQSKLTNRDVRLLSDIPFILVEDDNVAKPGKVVFSLSNKKHFQPYLYKLPPFLTCYSKLFQKVGVAAEATVNHLVEVLSTIYEETAGKETLHGNLKKTVSVVTEHVFKHLEQNKMGLENVKLLYLPGSDGKLHESSTLVFDDCFLPLVMESHVLTFFDFQHLKTVYPPPDICKSKELIKLLPPHLRPQMVSQITKEVVSVGANEFCGEGEDCKIRSGLEQLLFSPIFQEGLVCLLRHENNGNLCEEETMQKCNAVFGKIEIICCLELKTIYLFKNNQLDGTCIERDWFIIRGNEDQYKIYLKHADLMHRKTWFQMVNTLADAINDLMDNKLPSMSLKILMEMLLCESPEEVIDVLKEKNIKWSKTKKSQYAYNLPKPGEPIPTEWHDALDMSILHRFKVGDYVGYLDPSEKELYIYAVIVEELECHMFTDCEIQMYRIRIGHNKTADSSVLDLYQFKRTISQKSKELVLVENDDQQEEICEKWYESAIEDIKKEIDTYLGKIWSLPLEEREKAIRRLYLKYHPDKNIGQKRIATEISKYLQQKVKDLEARQNSSSQSFSTNRSNPSRGFSNCWRPWDSEASNHRRHHDHFNKRTNCNYNFWSYHQSDTRPNPAEAERWVRQAKCDMKAAEHSVGHHQSEWVFYKVHQAVKKALLAVHYFKKGQCNKKYSISSLVHQVSTYSLSLSAINEQVLQMVQLGVNKHRTQYPHFHSPPGIPNDCIPCDKEAEVIDLAKNVLQTIEDYVYQSEPDSK
ncbi:sacsin isoform X1 [Xenopus laevis]|uniref:Sacsin isoform X1 n=2 Tax=Xenopus laevis TaxID=8355 RepID=A0A8J1LDF6_XENLA|nr:sacsin isoform X1 [Xenopus laevis]